MRTFNTGLGAKDFEQDWFLQRKRYNSSHVLWWKTLITWSENLEFWFISSFFESRKAGDHGLKKKSIATPHHLYTNNETKKIRGISKFQAWRSRARGQESKGFKVPPRFLVEKSDNRKYLKAKVSSILAHYWEYEPERFGYSSSIKFLSKELLRQKTPLPLTHKLIVGRNTNRRIFCGRARASWGSEISGFPPLLCMSLAIYLLLFLKKTVQQ